MGRDVFKQGKYIRGNIGYMPESECLIPDICGVDLVSYLGTLSGMPSSEAMKRAHEVLYYVGLDDERYRQVESFSTGMKQRLKLAQALVHDPKILFLDEPTSGMDPQGRKELLDLIRDIVKVKPINIIFSTHLLHDVEYTCNHVIILNKGKVLSVDSLENITKLETVSYQLKLSSNPGQFIEKLTRLNIPVQEMDKGIIQVILSRSQTARQLFEISRQCGTSIIHFKQGTTSLEERFIQTIEGDHVD
jgi:ABC-2 type transport system ATP-binding protein